MPNLTQTVQDTLDEQKIATGHFWLPGSSVVDPNVALVQMWDQLEAQQQGAQLDIISKARKEQAKPEPIEESVVAEAAEQGAAMRSQINLFWGNVLFEHSQVEYKVGLPSWKELLDAALAKFVSAGAATDEIDGAN
ncbi:unnamed protein product [Calypogeia fissa]